MEILRNDDSNLKSSNSQTSPLNFDTTNPKSSIQLASSTSAHTLKITDLKPALKKPNRVNVFLNDEFAFSLDLAQIVDLKIKKGKTLTPEELKNLRAESEFGKLYQRALEWVLTRPHSIKETKDYLTRCKKRRETDNRQKKLNNTRSVSDRKKYRLSTKKLPEITPETTARVLDQLIVRGYLNDEKFALYFVENRSTKKGISRRRLEQELRKKGIADPLITQALETIARDETEDLKKLILKKRPKYQDDQKLINYLLRQGFPYDLIRLVLEKD